VPRKTSEFALPNSRRPPQPQRAEDVSALFNRLKGDTSFVRLVDRNAGTVFEGVPHPSRLHQLIRDGSVNIATLNPLSGLPMSRLKNDPDPATVLGAAHLFGITVHSIRDAVAVSLGMPARPTSDPTVIARLRGVKGIEKITPAQSDLLADMAKVMIRGD